MISEQHKNSQKDAVSPYNRQCGESEYLFKDVVAVTVAKLGGTVDFQRLNHALNRVLNDNPLLACRIIKRGRDIFFCHDPKIQNILSAQTVAGDREEAEAIEKVLSWTFPAGAPLIHCRLITHSGNGSHTLVAAFSHSIYDGVSLSHFFNALLAACAERASNHSPVCRPLEEQIKRKKTFAEFRSFIKREFSFRRAGRVGFPFHQTAPVDKRSTRFVYRQISLELTKKIASASRKARTTPHGAIMAAILLAMARRLPAGKHSLSMANNVDMRAPNKIPMEQMGVYVSVINNLVDVSADTEFWTLAKTCRKNLSLDAKRNMPAMAALVYSFLAKFTPKFIENMVKNGSGMGRVNDLCISNVGTVTLKEYENSITVENIISHVAIHQIGADYGLIPVDYQGRTGFNFLYSNPLTSTAEAEGIMLDFLLLLRRSTEEIEFFPLRG